MKKALVSPNEIREAGYRVAEVAEVAFEVAAPLFWVDCADDVQADVYLFNPQTNSIELAPVIEVLASAPEQVATQPQPVVSGAQAL